MIVLSAYACMIIMGAWGGGGSLCHPNNASIFNFHCPLIGKLEWRGWVGGSGCRQDLGK